MYVDALFDKEHDLIKVVERDSKGERIFKEHPVRYTFYYPDPKGKYTSIYGDPLAKVTCRNTKDFRKELSFAAGKEIYESDINPVVVHLSENYLNAEAPKLNICFFDIETDMQPYAYPSGHKVKINTSDKEITVFELAQLPNKDSVDVFDDTANKWVPVIKSKYLEGGPGYSSPEDAFMPITAITVYLKWLGKLVTLALPPKSMTLEQAQDLVSNIPDTYLFEDEADMLDTFLELIADADILSGWNSEGYDIPYTVNRVTRVLSKEDTKRFCLWGKLPRRREYEKYGKAAITYDLHGRVHLDSLELYRKYTYEERHTYRLDAIGEMEIGENKTVYEGTLDQLYNNDFHKFIVYNRQDTLLLNKLDDKLKFIDLANKIAHENTVLLQTTMGAVAVTEQAIINEAHRRGFQVPNRIKRDENADTSAAGAYVAYPKEGLQDWVGSLDINSLYPSAIRALNMGNETIVGQLRQTETDSYINELMTLKKKSFAASWEGMFGSIEYSHVMDKRIDKEITLDWVDGDSTVHSGAELYKLIFDSNRPWMLSANGTIFTYEKEGVIPGLLKRWYAERKTLQAELKACLNLSSGISIDEEFAKQLQL